MNVSIFIKKLGDVQELVSDIRECRGTTRLDTLQMLLSTAMPTREEVDLIRTYTGDSSKLAPPESFFLHLVAIPDYSLRIRMLKFRMDFHLSMEKLAPQVRLLSDACEQILASTALLRVFVVICKIGNYLNEGSSAGDAAGFKLNSLWKVIELKANTGHETLLHFITKNDPSCVDNLKAELSLIPEAAKIPSPSEIESDFGEIEKQRADLEKELNGKHEPVFKEMGSYIKIECKAEIEVLAKSFFHLSDLRSRMATYFMERPNEFKIEECIRMFRNFLLRLEKAHQENLQKEESTRKKEQKAKAVSESPANARRASFFPNTENGIGDELATLLHKTETIAGRRNSAVSFRKASDELLIPVSGRRFSVIDRIREKREKEEREQKELEKQSKEGLKVKTIAEDEKESAISLNFSPRSSDFQQNVTQEIDSASRALVCRNEQVCSPVACETPHSDISVDSTYGSQSGRQLSPLTPEGKGNTWTSTDSIPIGDLPSSPPNKLSSNESDVLHKTQESSAKTSLKDQKKKPTTNGLDLCGIRVEEIDENRKPNIVQPTRKMLTRTITQTTFTKPAPKRSDSTVKSGPSNTATTTTTTTFTPKRVMPGVIRRTDSLGSERGKTSAQLSRAPSTTSTSRPSIRTVPTPTEKKLPTSLKVLPRTPSTTSSNSTTPANKPMRLSRGATSGALLMSTKSQQQSQSASKPPPPRRVTAPVAPIPYNRQVSTSARPSLVQTGVVQPKTSNIVTTTIEKPRLLRATVVNKKPISSDVTEKPRMARTLRSTASADPVSNGTKIPSSSLAISRTPTPPKVSTVPQQVAALKRQGSGREPPRRVANPITPPAPPSGISSDAKKRLKSLAERSSHLEN